MAEPGCVSSGAASDPWEPLCSTVASVPAERGRRTPAATVNRPNVPPTAASAPAKAPGRIPVLGIAGRSEDPVAASVTADEASGAAAAGQLPASPAHTIAPDPVGRLGASLGKATCGPPRT